MNEADGHSAPDGSDRLWGLCLAVVFGSFFLCFLTGLVFQSDDPDGTVPDYIGVLVLTGWLGLMAAGGIGMSLRRRRAEGLVNWLLSILAASLFAGMIGSTSWQAWNRIAGHETALSGDGAGLVLVLIWAVFSVACWTSKDFPGSTAILWPLIVLLLAPLGFGMLLLSLLLFVAGGDWLGSTFGHPYLGAVLGLGSFVALFAFLVRLSRRWA